MRTIQLLILFLPIISLAQCDGNILLNGDFESDTIGSRVTGIYWDATFDPDINGLMSPNPDGPNGSWDWNGSLIPSSYGVQWQNMFGPETISQSVQVQTGKRYLLSFEFANQQIFFNTSDNVISSDTVSIVVSINGIPSFESINAYDLFVWQSACYSFIIQEDSVTITFEVNTPGGIDRKDGYIGIDNICLIEDSSYVNLDDRYNTCLSEELIIEDLGLDVFGLLWSDGSTNNNFNVTQSGQYWLDITDNCGTYREEFEVIVEDCGCKLYIPNTFNPNLDDDNGFFSLRASCELYEYELLIYDKWGNPVFSSFDIMNSWNGKIRVDNAASGIYSYRLTYNFFDNVIEKFGTLNLLR